MNQCTVARLSGKETGDFLYAPLTVDFPDFGEGSLTLLPLRNEEVVIRPGGYRGRMGYDKHLMALRKSGNLLADSGGDGSAYSAVHLLISRIKAPSLDYRTVHTETNLIYRESTGTL